MSLFRPQAIDHRKQRLYGDVLLLPKVSHSLLLGALCCWVVLVFIWLFMGTYARKESVLGWLEPPTGVVRVYPETPGNITKVLVTEGTYVEEGKPLIIVKNEAVLSSGQQLSTKLLVEYETQQNLLEEEIVRTDSINQGRTNELSNKISLAEEDYTIISNQLKNIKERYALMLVNTERLNKLKDQGYVSNTEYDEARQQQLALQSTQQALLRNQVTQKNQIAQLRAEKSRLPNESANSLSQLKAKLSDISQQIDQVNGQSERVLRASRSGIVNNLQAHEGQRLSGTSEAPLLTLLPDEEQLSVHLLIPVRSAGFIAQGQQIDIRFDAFPYQKFGLYKGEISQVSKTILLPNELLNTPVSSTEPVYRITARLAQANVQAYGENFPLRPGMTLSADIRLSDRTLIQWLFEPLFSLKGRL